MSDQIIQLGQIAGALVAILTLAGMLIKYGVVKPIKTYIDQATYPIQAHANGGKSLPDVIRKLEQIDAKIEAHIRDDHGIDDRR